MVVAFRHVGLVLEPGGAVVLAAVPAGAVPDGFGMTGAILSGGGVGLDAFRRPTPAYDTPGRTPPVPAIDLGFPTYTQYASADLIEAIVYRGHDPRDDPRWPESGAADLDEYATWCGHMCGVACLATYLHARDGHTPPLFDLLAGCRKYGAYTVGDDGTIRGLIYAPFAAYVRAEHSITAAVHRDLPVGQLLAELAHDAMVIASVHKEIRRPALPSPGRGGHLVLVTGRRDGCLLLRNPSGHTAQARSARVPIELFEQFYAGRGIGLATRSDGASPRRPR